MVSAGELSVDGYVRVSRVGGRRGERFISPTVQRELIEGWAAAAGAHVLQVFEELDQSGRAGERPMLEKALGRVESGISQGIVVAWVTRFGRSLLSGIAALDRIHVAGGRFVAVQNGLDTSTDSGRLVLHMLFALGEWESDRIRADWELARASAVRRGVYLAAGSPAGYRKTRSGRLRPDPETAGTIAEAFRRRAQGESFASLARCLEERGVRTAYGNAGWTSISTAKLLRSRVYLGEVRQGLHVHELAHPPLVDTATWQAAQHPKRAVLRHSPQPALLARLVRCAGCSLTMSAYWHRVHGRALEVIYRCRGHSAAGACPGPASIAALYLEPHVEERVFDLLRRRRRAPAAELADAELALREATAALTRYRDSDRILEALGEDDYLAGVAARSEHVRTARLRLAALRDANVIHALPATAELERRWLDLSDDERRELIARVIDCVFVAAGQGHIEERVTVCRAGTAPSLPRVGSYRGGEARPFTPQARHRLPAIRPWPAERIERELADYLTGHRAWPTAPQFAAAGRRRLYDQIVRHAGIACWAHHFGLPILFRVRSREAWTEPRIRAALELYLRRKQRFPTQQTFTADGLGSLHSALRQTGGVQRWSNELGVPLGASQRRPSDAQLRRHQANHGRAHASQPSGD
jgi:DNA invertase Pin-like site-specific DNA recombinase